MAQEAHGSGEVWNLSARGGSGVYLWSVVDQSVAEVRGSAQVRSIAVGKTSLVCRDQKNFENWDSIEIEVATINQLSWLEERVEIEAPVFVSQVATDGSVSQVKDLGEQRVLSLFALDSKGRKFTNCTAVRPAYEVRGETHITVNKDFDSEGESSKYQMIKGYLTADANMGLIAVRQRFDEQESVIYTDQLNTVNTPMLSNLLMLHNNFGICAQQEIYGESEGLARLGAAYTVHEYANGPSRVIQSEFAEIVVYN